MQKNIVVHPELAAEGQRKIEWVRRNMPILRQLEREFAAEQPFAGKRIAVCIHLEAKTAYLALVLRAGGAAVAVTGSNPESTKDDVVAALAAEGLHVYARHGARADWPIGRVARKYFSVHSNLVRTKFDRCPI